MYLLSNIRIINIQFCAIRMLIRYKSCKSNHVHRWSRILRSHSLHDNQDEVNEHDLTKTHNPLAYKGLIKTSSSGIYILTPLIVRSLEKLCRIINDQMRQIHAQKIVMPSLVSSYLWNKSGRWNEMGEEIFRLKDRQNKEFCLAPTHEEVVSQLVSFIKPLVESSLPLYLYQISTKFRDERRVKLGLLRAREFIMKDLYTFDCDENAAKETYDKVCQSYDRLFEILNLPVTKVIGSVGNIGGKYSHEYHLFSEIGEDNIVTCDSCNAIYNMEMSQRDEECSYCKSKNINVKRGIEVGHAFFLGTRYSKDFDLRYIKKQDKSLELTQMGCFGLGVTRILTSSVSILSDDQDLRWPLEIAPFKICLELPKKGSKEDISNGALANDLVDILNELSAGDFIIDDRTQFSIGKRMKDALALGIPYIVIAGKRITEPIPLFEVMNSYKNESNYLTQSQLIDYLKNEIRNDFYL